MPRFMLQPFKPLLVSSRVSCRSTRFAGTLLPDYKEQEPNLYTTSTYDGTLFTVKKDDGTEKVFNVHPLSENKYRLKAAFDVSAGLAVVGGCRLGLQISPPQPGPIILMESS